MLDDDGDEIIETLDGPYVPILILVKELLQHELAIKLLKRYENGYANLVGKVL